MDVWYLDQGQDAALVLDETFVTPDTSHQTLETRSAMPIGKTAKFTFTRAHKARANTACDRAWLNISPDKVVFISEYTERFGSKITGGVTMIIPACWRRRRTPGDDANQPRERPSSDERALAFKGV